MTLQSGPGMADKRNEWSTINDVLIASDWKAAYSTRWVNVWLIVSLLTLHECSETENKLLIELINEKRSEYQITVADWTQNMFRVSSKNAWTDNISWNGCVLDCYMAKSVCARCSKPTGRCQSNGSNIITVFNKCITELIITLTNLTVFHFINWHAPLRNWKYRHFAWLDEPDVKSDVINW